MTAVAMDRELTLLLEIQDLRAQRRALRNETGIRSLEEDQFGIDPDVASQALGERIRDLITQLSEPVQRRLARIADRVDRVVVPVISGTCYGCFVSVPTAAAGDSDPNADLQSCEHCGRFLYFLS